MPFSPRPVCPRCRRRHCTCPPLPTRVRKSRPEDPAYRRLRDVLVKRHVEQFGWWCPGAPDLRHESHRVYALHLDVDHINGDHSDHRPENLRILCRTVNRGRKRVADQVRKRKGDRPK
jgi:hypothetical protein